MPIAMPKWPGGGQCWYFTRMDVIVWLGQTWLLETASSGIQRCFVGELQVLNIVMEEYLYQE